MSQTLDQRIEKALDRLAAAYPQSSVSVSMMARDYCHNGRDREKRATTWTVCLHYYPACLHEPCIIFEGDSPEDAAERAILADANNHIPPPPAPKEDLQMAMAPVNHMLAGLKMIEAAISPPAASPTPKEPPVADPVVPAGGTLTEGKA